MLHGEKSLQRLLHVWKQVRSVVTSHHDIQCKEEKQLGRN